MVRNINLSLVLVTLLTSAGCTYRESLLYDQFGESSKISPEIIDQVVTSGRVVYLSYWRDGKLNRVRCKIEFSNNSGKYRVYNLRENRGSVRKAFTEIRVDQIVELRVVERDGLRSSEVATAIVIAGIIIVVLGFFFSQSGAGSGPQLL